MFTHLDDPTPYTPPPGLRSTVRHRARRRRQRRAAVAGGVASVAALGIGSLVAVRDRLEPQQIDVGGLTDEPGTGPAVIEAEPADPGDPVTFLVVGLDDARPDGRLEAQRYADTIALVRVEPGSGEVRLLTVPRDLVVPTDGGEMRASGAFATGGPERLIRGLDEELGVPIHHYVQVELDGAMELIDALGGVRVAVDRPIRDEQTGTALAAGCHTLDGEAAVELGQARHIEVQRDDGFWVMDRFSALSREARGVVVAAALVQAVGRFGPSDLPGLVRTGLRSIAVDDSLASDDLVRLARDARDDRLVPLSLPVVDAKLGRSDVLRLGDGAAAVVAAFHDGGTDPVPMVIDGQPVIDDTGLHTC